MYIFHCLALYCCETIWSKAVLEHFEVLGIKGSKINCVITKKRVISLIFLSLGTRFTVQYEYCFTIIDVVTCRILFSVKWDRHACFIFHCHFVCFLRINNNHCGSNWKKNLITVCDLLYIISVYHILVDIITKILPCDRDAN